MNKLYDFADVEVSSELKTMISIRIDSDVLRWYKKKQSKGGYQKLMNAVLRKYMELNDG